MTMPKMFTLTLGAMVLTACSHTTAPMEKHSHWGYTGHESPEHWAALSPKFAICSEGKSQSPVDIVNTVDGKLAPIHINYQPSQVEIVNNGHTIQVDFKEGNNSMEMNGTTYTLKQFHFHVPSENKIKGKSFPLESHFVHTDQNGNLAVLGVLYVVSNENKHLAPIWNNFPQTAGKKYQLTQPFDPSNLIPKKRDYYRFSGSLTTPPCSEGVKWLVLKQYDNISQSQVDAFSAVMKGHNSRPVQPINARVIVE